jgi:hypothetical protein
MSLLKNKKDLPNAPHKPILFNHQGEPQRCGRFLQSIKAINRTGGNN